MSAVVHIDSEVLEVKFEGSGITPESVKLDDLARGITLLRDLLEPIIIEKHPELKGDLDELLAFQDIGNRSVSFRNRVKNLRDITLAAYTTLNLGISNRDPGLLPYDTLQVLERTSDFNSRYGTSVSFGFSTGGTFNPVASFIDEFQREKIPWIQGRTTQYGHFSSLGVGRTGKYVGKLRLASGNTVAIHLDATNAKKFRELVLENVRVTGTGIWVGSSLRLSSITPTEVARFGRLNAEEGFNLLAEDLGKLWRETDPDNFLSE